MRWKNAKSLAPPLYPWLAFKNRFFYRVNIFNKFKIHAKVLNLKLISILSNIIHNKATGGSKDYWLGLSRESPKKGWKWLDKSPFIFLNWDSSYKFESDGSKLCAFMDKNGQWKSSLCYSYVLFVIDSLKYNYICEKPKQGLATTTASPATTKPGFDYGCTNGWTRNGNKCIRVYDAIR